MFGVWIGSSMALGSVISQHIMEGNMQYIRTIYRLSVQRLKERGGAEAPPTVPFEGIAYHLPLVLDFWCTPVIPALKGAEDCCEFKPSLGYL